MRYFEVVRDIANAVLFSSPAIREFFVRIFFELTAQDHETPSGYPHFPVASAPQGRNAHGIAAAARAISLQSRFAGAAGRLLYAYLSALACMRVPIVFPQPEMSAWPDRKMTCSLISEPK